MCRHKSFWRGTKCSQIFGLAQKIWTGTKHFGTCKRTRHKYNKVPWFVAKNLSNFVSLPLKLNNPQCHTVQGRRNWGCQGWARGPFASHPIFGRYKSFISPSSELLLLLGTTGPLEFLNHPPVLRFACWLCLPDFLNTPFCLHF